MFGKKKALKAKKERIVFVIKDTVAEYCFGPHTSENENQAARSFCLSIMNQQNIDDLILLRVATIDLETGEIKSEKPTEIPVDKELQIRYIREQMSKYNSPGQQELPLAEKKGK